MKKIYCFISSTFADMQSERDLVKKIIMPTINQEIMKYGISMECIDLRWGIDAAKLTLEERCRKVISSCFDEIRKSHPYFLSFIGDRYGTVLGDIELQALYSYGLIPYINVEKSITEMEIDYARDLYEDRSKILFCMRKKTDYQDDEEKKQAFSEDDHGKELLNNLKNKIREEYTNTNQIIEYDAVWNKEKGKFILSDNLKDEIVNHILSHIEYENYNIPQNIYDVNNNYFNTIINKNNESFAGREEEKIKILNFIRYSKHKLLTIVGASGIGKTFLISNVTKMLDEHNIKYVKYLCGINNNTIDVNDIVKEFIYNLNNKNIDNIDQINVDNFIENINKISFNEKVCLIIDAIDQLKNPLELFKILNTFLYSDNIKIIISTTSDFLYLDRLNTLDRQKLTLTNLKIEEAKQIFDKYFVINKKDKIKNVRNFLFKIKKIHLITNPIYLSLIIQRLNNLSYYDFDKIYKINKNDNFYEALEKYLISSLKESSNSIEKELEYLKNTILNEVENGQEILDFISITEDGISYDEIEFILNKLGKNYATVEFSNFLKMCDSFISEYNDGYWRIKHKYIKNYYYKQVKKDSSYRHKCKILADYYSEINDINKQIFYLIQTKEYKEIYELMKNNINNIEFIKVFSNKISDIDYEQLILQILEIDTNNLLINFLNKIIKENYLEYSVSKRIIKILKNNHIDLSISLVYNAFLQKHYFQTVKLIKRIKKTQNNLQLNIRKIELLSQMKYKDVSIKKIYKVIEEQGVLYTYSNDSERKIKAIEYINDLKIFFNAVSETKNKGRFFTYGMFYSIDNMLPLFNTEERIEILSQIFLFLANRRMVTFLWKRFKNRKNHVFFERLKYQYEKTIEYKKEIDEYLNSDYTNTKLKADAAFALAKFCDNYEVEDDYTYAIIAKDKYKEVYENELTNENIKNYAIALDMKLDNDEMLGNTNKDELKEMVTKAKELVFLYPSTEHYDVLEDAYRRCKKEKDIYSFQDYKDETEYHLTRKSMIKYEMSAEIAYKKKARSVTASLLILIALLVSSLYFFLYFVTSNPIKEVELMFRYIVISFSLNVSSILSLQYLSDILIDKKYKLHIDYIKIIISLVILIVTVIYINSGTAFLKESDYQKLVNSITYNIGEFFSNTISIAMIFFIIAISFVKKVYRSSSDIINYQRYVLKRNVKIISTIFFSLIVFSLIPSFCDTLDNFKQFIIDLYENENVSLKIFVIDSIKILFSSLMGLFTVFSIYVMIKRSNQSDKKKKQI